MAAGQDREPITQTDVTAFATKLEQWGKGLPVKERGMLQLLLARAAGSPQEPLDVGGFALPSIPDATTAIFQPLLRGPDAARIRSWVQDGEPWVQGA